MKTYPLWTVAHPDKWVEVRCVFDPAHRELRLIGGRDSEVIREVHPTTDVACARAEVLKERLIALQWRLR
jgi:hypothetical protein